MSPLRLRLRPVIGWIALLSLPACAGAPARPAAPLSSAAISASASSSPAVSSSASSTPAVPPPPASSTAGADPPSAPVASAPVAPAPPPQGTLKVPVAVVVENAPDARPQSGLDQADIVWEILAEGFITRFFAIFDTQASAQIGPVRSARIYFDQLDRAYGLPYAHAGGNADALAWIGTWHLPNLDEIYGAGGYFWRSSSRQMPHNLYTSTDLLERAARDRAFTPPPLAWPAKGPQDPAAQATAGVTLTYYDDPKVYTYIAGWNWQDGAWVRTVNGDVQVMTDGRTVRAGTVLVLVVPDAPDRTDPENPLALYMLWDRGGQAWVLRDGTRTEGTWTMAQDGLPVVTASGQPLGVGQGPYWYEVVPSASDVRFR